LAQVPRHVTSSGNSGAMSSCASTVFPRGVALAIFNLLLTIQSSAPEAGVTVPDVEAACNQHGSCISCTEVSGTWYRSGCKWCLEDFRCHASGSWFDVCNVTNEVKNTTSCPSPTPSATNFSIPDAYDMILYANAAYFDNPHSEPLPPGFEVTHRINYTMGTFNMAFMYMGIDTLNKRLVLAFRGTNSLTQLLDEMLMSSLVPLPEFHAAKINKFFLAATQNLWQYFSPALTELRLRCKDCGVWITGHSLGGAMAMLAGFYIHYWQIHDNPIVYSIGQPRVGDYNFSQLLSPGRFFRLTTGADLVPHLPPCSGTTWGICTQVGYYHAGMEIWFPVGDYAQGVMCHYRECAGQPIYEDYSCSDGIASDDASGSILDHHAYWGVIPKGFCGQRDDEDSTILV